MNQTGKSLTIIWEEILTPEAEERLAAAFTMLLGPRRPPEWLEQ